MHLGDMKSHGAREAFLGWESVIQGRRCHEDKRRSGNGRVCSFWKEASSPGFRSPCFPYWNHLGVWQMGLIKKFQREIGK